MKTTSIDKELEALKTVLHALEPLGEQQKKFIVKTVVDRLNITIAAHTSPVNEQRLSNVETPASGGGKVAPSAVSKDNQTPNQFLKLKQPRSDVQRIACLAYYLTHSKCQPQFKTEDLVKLNNDAHGTRISNPWMSVNNATNQNKFLCPIGEGKKQITTLGEEVVDALPNQEAVKEILNRQRKPRNKRSRKAVKAVE